MHNLCIYTVILHENSFCRSHMLPQITVYQSSIFFYVHLIYTEQPTMYFSILLHDIQDIKN
jgi:hypothetical protein